MFGKEDFFQRSFAYSFRWSIQHGKRLLDTSEADLQIAFLESSSGGKIGEASWKIYKSIKQEFVLPVLSLFASLSLMSVTQECRDIGRSG